MRWVTKDTLPALVTELSETVCSSEAISYQTMDSSTLSVLTCSPDTRTCRALSPQLWSGEFNQLLAISPQAVIEVG